jgi:hypothetical protein
MEWSVYTRARIVGDALATPIDSLWQAVNERLESKVSGGNSSVSSSSVMFRSTRLTKRGRDGKDEVSISYQKEQYVRDAELCRPYEPFLQQCVSYACSSAYQWALDLFLERVEVVHEL